MLVSDATLTLEPPPGVSHVKPQRAYNRIGFRSIAQE